MFTVNSFLQMPVDGELDLRLKYSNNRIFKLIKASNICNFNTVGNTLIINTTDSTEPTLMTFSTSDEANKALLVLFDAWKILKNSYQAFTTNSDTNKYVKTVDILAGTAGLVNHKLKTEDVIVEIIDNNKTVVSSGTVTITVVDQDNVSLSSNINILNSRVIIKK